MLDKDRADIQGILFSSYSHLKCAAYLLLRVDDVSHARQWLARISTEVTNSIVAPAAERPDVNVNVAITAQGLVTLGVPKEVMATFSPPFRRGMHSPRRARILGDTAENAPRHWDWGNAERPVDLVLMVYGKDDDILRREVTRRTAALAAGGLVVAFPTPGAGRHDDSREHFGFNDGIGQPVIAGTEQKSRQESRTHHATPLPPGEFLVGHETVYGTMAPGPTVDPALDPGQLLPPAPDGAGRGFGHNGSYMVFRQLQQDVAAFWNFVDDATKRDGASDPQMRNLLAAKFVGRWTSGASLTLHPDSDPHAGTNTLDDFNDFSYADDKHGYGCPVGAHVRRTNPRDTLTPGGAPALQSANRHRIMRRGRSYGERITDPLRDDGKKRGLHFICFNSDIERQFEFIQQTWVDNASFGGLEDEVDPLIGDQSQCSGAFTVPADPLRRRASNLCRFVTVRGGSYFFLPSIRALRWIGSL
jgi:Dyp-type peroxidase family